MMFERLEQLARRKLSGGEVAAIGKVLPIWRAIPQQDERERTWVLLRAIRRARLVELGLEAKK
jgi:hypothetical protein